MNEAAMRYVQKRVENFVLRVADDAAAQRWHPDGNATEPGACEIVNLSFGGAAMLLPKRLLLPSNELQLRIPPPEGHCFGVTVLPAEVRWTDERYSLMHSRIGLQFGDYDERNRANLRKLMDWFSLQANTALRCSIRC